MIMKKTRNFVAGAAMLSALMAVTACGSGEGPEAGGGGGGEESCDLETVTILVSSEAGSPVDTMARQVADSLKATGFEPSVVIETRTGGSGAVALSALVGAPADGSTLYAMTRSQAVLFAGGQLNDIEPDALDYLTRLQDDPYAWVVQADSEFKTLDDLIAYAEEKPGELTVGGFGAGSAHHLAALRIAQEAGIEVNWVPFDGGSEAVTALLGGFIEVANTQPGPGP
jgi:tripartite-type tricarboxylate transporter receptor subunit TctC